jgi:hypothetical protein
MGKTLIGVLVAIVAGYFGYRLAARMMEVSRHYGFEASSAPAPEAIPAWKSHTSKKGRFTIQLPVEFTAFDPASPKLEELILDSAGGDPKTRTMLETALKSGGFTFWAFDLTKTGKDSGRVVNAILRSKSPNLHQRSGQIESLRNEFASRLPRGSTLIQFGKTRHPIGNALFTEIEFAMTDSGTLKRTRSFAYLMGVGKNELSITFTCPASEAKEFELLAQRAMSTLRILD